jgi:hypothetical protein
LALDVDGRNEDAGEWQSGEIAKTLLDRAIV